MHFPLTTEIRDATVLNALRSAKCASDLAPVIAQTQSKQFLETFP
jgi:hypothetical protein